MAYPLRYRDSQRHICSNKPEVLFSFKLGVCWQSRAGQLLCFFKVTQGPRLLLPCCPTSLKIALIQKGDASALAPRRHSCIGVRRTWGARSCFSKEVTQMLLTLAHSQHLTRKLESCGKSKVYYHEYAEGEIGFCETVKQFLT